MVRALAGLLGALIAAAPAAAKEYPLDPEASGVSIDGIVHMTPIEIDVTRPDYVLIVRFRNDSEQAVMLRLNELRCLRGTSVFRPYDDNDTEWLYLPPHEPRVRHVTCEHGPGVTGDFGLMIRRIVTNPYGDRERPGEALVEEVIWRLREADITRERQLSGEELACLQFRRPPHRALSAVRPGPVPSCDCSKICGIEAPAADTPAEAVAPATLLAPLAPPAPAPPPEPRTPPPAATLRPR